MNQLELDYTQCGCCQPPRPVYLRAQGRLDSVHHEGDHTPAAPGRAGEQIIMRRETAARGRERRRQAAGG